MMAGRPENFSLSELNKYIPSIEKLDVNISDNVVAEIKKEIENKILVSNRLRLNTKDSSTFFDIDIDYKNKSITWKNPDSKFIFGRFLLYSKFLIDSYSPKQYGILRSSVFCFGQVSDANSKSNGNIDYVNKLCGDAGISCATQAPSETQVTAEPMITVSEAVPTITVPTEAVPTVSKREQRMENIKKLRTPSPDGTPKTTKKIKDVVSDQRDTATVPAQQYRDSEPDVQLSVISPDCFWDYQTACEIVNAEPEPYLIEGMFRKGTINIIGATPNSGKTTLLFDVMGAVASGAKFLTKPDSTGGFESHQGACVFVDFDGDKVDTASRLKATIDTYSEITGVEPKDIPILVRYMPLDWTGSDDQFPEKIHKEISALPEPYNTPAIIAFDTYSAFANVENENEATQAQKVFGRLKKLKALFSDCIPTIFLTMHLRKSSKSFKELTMEDLRGTGATAGAGSDIWLLGEVADQPATKKLKQVKSKGRTRDTEIKTLSLAYDNNDDGSYSRVRFFMTEGTDEATARKIQSAQKQKNDSKREKSILAFIATHPRCSINRMVKPQYSPDRLEMGIKTATPIVDKLIRIGKVYNLSPDENAYCLVINPNQSQEEVEE